MPTEKQLQGALIIKQLAERTKCLSCKHKFSEPLLRPAKKPERGKLQSNFSPEWLFHMSDTHGYPVDIFCGWITHAIYNTDSGSEIPLVPPYSKLFEPLAEAMHRAKEQVRKDK